jgi:hypothetical protein
MDSPLIPKKLYGLLEKYRETVNYNVTLMSDILTECSQELPTRYPDIKTLEEAKLEWIQAKYISKSASLEERAKEISDYIRNYFATDNLFD